MPQITIPLWLKWVIVITSLAYSVGTSVAARRKAKKAARDAAGIAVMLKEPTAPWVYVYGERRVSGPIVFAQETGEDRKYLQLVIVIAPHEVFEIKKVWLDEESVGLNPDGTVESDKYAERVRVWTKTGAPGQTAFESLVDRVPGKWTTNHTLTGCAALHVQLEWDPAVFHGGIPNISATVRGKKIRDFIYGNGTEYQWSANPVNVAVDLLMDADIGPGFTLDQFHLPTLRASAAHCHESVAVLTTPPPTDGSHYRYSCNLVVDSSVDFSGNLGQVAESMAGAIVRSNGLWFVKSGKYEAPTLTITDSDLIGPITITPRRSKGALCNAVRGVFISEPPDFLHTETEFPAYESAVYLAQDNGEKLWSDLDMPYCRCPVQAQRIAKIHLEKRRQQIAVGLKVGLVGLRLMPTSTVALTIPRYGWVSKVFEVVSWKLEVRAGDGPGAAVSLGLTETASTVYDWVAASDETPYDPAPDTLLPNPFNIPDPQNPTVERVAQVNSDGVWRVQAKVSWDLSQSGYVTGGGSVITRYKLSTESVWIEASPVPANQETMILPALLAGLTYNVEVCNVNSLGTRSDFVACSPSAITLVVDDEAPTFNSSLGFTLGVLSGIHDPLPTMKDPQGIVYAKGGWIRYNLDTYPTTQDFDRWEVVPKFGDYAMVPPDGSEVVFTSGTADRFTVYATKAQAASISPASPMRVYVRAVDGSGNATDWVRIGLSITSTSWLTDVTGDMVNQNSNAVNTSGIQTGSAGASSVQKVLCRFPHYLVHTCVGGSTVETVNVSLTNRGFSTAPDKADITFTSAHDNVIEYYDRAASTSTNGVLKLVREDGTTFGAGWVYGINVEFVEYD